MGTSIIVNFLFKQRAVKKLANTTKDIKKYLVLISSKFMFKVTWISYSLLIIQVFKGGTVKNYLKSNLQSL